MKRLLFTLIFLLPFVGSTYAAGQEGLPSIKVDATKASGQVIIKMSGDFHGIRPESKEMLEIAPAIKSLDGTHLQALRPFAIVGANRAKVYRREEALSGSSPLTRGNYVKVIPVKELNQIISYQSQVPFESWMHKGSIVLLIKRIGCAGCEKTNDEVVLQTGLFPEAYQPQYLTSIVEPQPELRKVREASLQAHFNYKVGRYELLKDYKSNASEFNRVRNFITPILSNKDLTLSAMAINGYASPEGRESSNKTLSLNRALSFKTYLIQEYHLNGNQISVKGHGEDWKGLVKALDNSSLSNKVAVLKIINTTKNLDARDAKIRALDGGKTYKKMLAELYPPLRRNEFSVSYVVKPYTVQDAKRIIFTDKAALLSLDEMFKVSKLFPKGSKEYNQVFAIAAKTYPNSNISQTNMAAICLLNKVANKGEIVSNLSRYTNYGPALNNLGIAYSQNGNYAKAKECFNKAISKGDLNAKHNLEELNKMLKDL